jgi:hypothetical protein
MRVRDWCLCAGLVILSASASPAAPPSPYEYVALAEYTGSATDSRILSFGTGDMVVAWVSPEGQICSRSIWGGALQPVEIHGLGSDPVLCQFGARAFLAWASGNRIYVRSYWGAWSVACYVSTGSGQTAHHPDFSIRPSASGPDLAWLEGASVIYCQTLPEGVYGTPEVAATDAENGVWYGLQLEASDWGTGIRPRVYYLLGGAYSLVYRERTGAGAWTLAVPWPTEDWDCFWPFRVCGVGGDPGAHYVLHLGIPRTCTCNTISFVYETGPGTWSPPDERTVHGAARNWPQHLGMASAGDPSAHCFWYQSFFSEALEFVGEQMYYQIYSPGAGWSEPWAFDRVGKFNDVSIGTCTGCPRKPEFCWIETTTIGSRVMALRYGAVGLSVDDETTESRLTAAPNPFTERVEIEWSAASPGPGRVEVFDVAGRHIRTLVTDGSHETRFVWDGRTESGISAPPGVYRLRAVGTMDHVRGSLIKVR